MFISSIINSKSIIIFLIIKVYIINNLKVNILIEIDNLELYRVTINFKTTIATIEIYENLTLLIYI